MAAAWNRRLAATGALASVFLFSSCERIRTEIDNSCQNIEIVVEQGAINWTTLKVEANIGTSAADCFPLKDAATYKIIATVKVNSKIDEDLFPVYGLSDSIRFQAVTAKGVVVGREDLPYKITRLHRSDNVSATFKDLSPSETGRITRILVGWVYE